MALLIFYVLLALGVSFLCSVLEAVLLSVTPSYVAAMEDGRPEAAEQLRRLKDDIDRPLAAILSLNTIAHTVGAAGAGAQAVVVYGDASVAIFSAVLTLLILVLSEIIPKTIGASYWRELAPTAARVLRLLILALYPLVVLSQGITRLLQRGEKQASVSREEITALADLGHQEGVFEKEESRILKNLLRFSSLRVKGIMTPRTVLFAFPETMTVGEVLEGHDHLRFSRIPLYGQNRDDVTGYVLKDDLLLKAAQDEQALPLAALRRDMLVVPDTLPLPEFFERLLDQSEHIALVVDEYGGVAGVASMEDVVETLLGLEIVDEADSAEDMQELARRQWLDRARRLGVVPEDFGPAPGKEAETVARLGITGGQPPPPSEDV